MGGGSLDGGLPVDQLGRATQGRGRTASAAPAAEDASQPRADRETRDLGTLGVRDVLERAPLFVELYEVRVGHLALGAVQFVAEARLSQQRAVLVSTRRLVRRNEGGAVVQGRGDGGDGHVHVERAGRVVPTQTLASRKYVQRASRTQRGPDPRRRPTRQRTRLRTHGARSLTCRRRRDGTQCSPEKQNVENIHYNVTLIQKKCKL